MFGKSKGKQGAGDKPVTLRNDFADAVFGNSFRTRSYKTTEGAPKAEWLQAVRVAGTRWTVLRQARLEGAEEINYTIEKEGLSFRDAVKMLSDHEIMQAEMPHVAIADEAELEALGLAHVRAFAEREGLVFDSLGHVHEPVEGHIVANGSFPVNAGQKAKEAWAARETQMAKPVLSPALPSRETMMFLAGINPQRYLQVLQTVRGFMRDREYGSASWHKCSHGRGSGERYDFSVTSTHDIEDSAFEHMFEILAEGEKGIGDFLSSVQGSTGRTDSFRLFSKQVNAAFYTVQFLSLLRLSRDINERLGQNEYIYTPKNLERALQGMKEALRTLGYRTEEEMGRMVEAHPGNVVPYIDKVIADMTALTPDLQKKQFNHGPIA